MNGQDRHERIAELFHRTLELPVEEREAILRDECAGDPALVREIRELLAADSTAHAPIPGTELKPRARPRRSWDGFVERLAEHSPGSSRYRREGEVARGGMGAILRVWDEDLGRPIAMKVALDTSVASQGDVRTPLDESTLGRFLEEAQVTAQLSHPGIVPVHELGVDAEGQVYFTMRLVKGRTLADVFELARAGKDGWTRTRALGVLLKVCEAMSYAHSKEVIHRDLKPSNVMVGAFGEVYVMDWGVAKVLGRDDSRDLRIREPGDAGDRGARAEGSDTPLLTMDGMVVGTPSYMSPEQARGEIDLLDQRTDVYAVGAMLYHLLTGQMPYVPSGTKPSALTVWSQVVESAPTSLEQLTQDVPGELRAICEKAMARDMNRRYSDVGELGEDLNAFLEGRVVHAYESGAWAEARKWVRRNRSLAASLAAVLVLLVSGLVSGFVLAGEANAQARRSSRITDFVVGMFETVKPEKSLGTSMMVREVLDAQARLIEHQLVEVPEVRAHVMDVMGRVYSSLGLHDEAEELFVQALALYRKSSPEHITCMTSIAKACLERGELERGMEFSSRAVAQGTSFMGAGDGITLVARSVELRALIGRGIDSAIHLAAGEALLSRLDSVVGPTHRDVVDFRMRLTRGLVAQGAFDRAARVSSQNIENCSGEFGDEHPWTLRARAVEAARLSAENRDGEAEAILRRINEKTQEVFGDEHILTISTREELGIALHALGSYEEAEEIYRKNIAVIERTQGAQSPQLISFRENLAALLDESGRLDEALHAYQEVSDLMTLNGASTSQWISHRHNRAVLFARMGRAEEARDEHLVNLEDEKALFDGDAPQVADTLHLAGVYLCAVAGSRCCSRLLPAGVPNEGQAVRVEQQRYLDHDQRPGRGPRHGRRSRVCRTPVS